MERGRRDFMKIGAAAALGALLPPGADRAEAEASGTPEAPPAPGPLRLLTFAPKAGAAPRTGALAANGRIVDLGAAASKSKKKLSFDPARMVSLIAAGAPALAEVRALLAAYRGNGLVVEDVRLFAPIPDPVRNVFAVGWNYLEHFEEGKALRDPNASQALPEHPVFFTKATHVVNGPFDSIPFDPDVSTSIDWEGELAVVIGRHGRNIPEEKALDFVFGFSVINDTTARDLQQKKHGGQWFKGKSLDGHGPMGPWIVTAAGFDYDNQHLMTRVNGVVKQDASTRQMYFKVPRIVSELSAGLTLEPGDIIATGTPPGIGYARKPPEFLKPGDVMETEIAGIGVIRNTIKAV